MAEEYAFADKEIEIGIDEAGRGPVLGPMVYGMCYWPAEVGDTMREQYGFIDSKQTTEEAREKMFEEIKDMDKKELGWDVGVGLPEHISNVQLAEMHAGGQNLNTLSYELAFTMLVRVLKKGFKVKRIICDAVGPEQTHKRVLLEYIRQHINEAETEIICCSKADDKYPVVSAASICAKVTRDQILHTWDFKEQKAWAAQ